MDSRIAGDEDIEYTSRGNMKAPLFKVVLEWFEIITVVHRYVK